MDYVLRGLLVGMASLLTMGCAHDFNLNTMSDPAASPEEQEMEQQLEDDADTPEPEEEEEEELPITEEEEEEDPPDEDDCEDTSDLVYVIDRDSEGLYLFSPDTLTFELLGHLDCSMWGQPSSMGIARDGHAFVRYSTGDVYDVLLEDMSCTETDYGADFGPFGMGYATQHSETWRDELFLANKTKLAVIDTVTWNLTTIGSLPSQAELTGNADGELWAFLPLESPAALAELDKGTGEVIERISVNDFPSPSSIDTFAFATWGGDFWLFVRTYGMGSSTDVYQVTPKGKLTKVLSDVGLNVVGAGVSTCAPSE
jgi:hypothetical protein